MFIIWILRRLFGWVRFRAEGGFPERFLNLAARENIQLWGTQRRGVSLSACCSARQYRRLRPLARKAGLRMRLHSKHGLPFVLLRHPARGGIAVGLAVYVSILWVLSGYIWTVNVNGNTTLTDTEILNVVEDFGLRRGSRITDLDRNELQLQVLSRLPELVWMTVNFKGSSMTVEVAERVQAPEFLNADGAPSNLIARRDGTVVRIETYSGQSVIQVGDPVVEGMLLVSGAVESASTLFLRRSVGTVLARTEHTITVSAATQETLSLPTGKVILRPTLSVLWWDIPLYNGSVLNRDYRQTVTEHFLTVGGEQLPLGLTFEYNRELCPTEVRRTREQAEALAWERLTAAEQDELALVQTVESRMVDTRFENGEVVLTAHYICLEDIGREVPLQASTE